MKRKETPLSDPPPALADPILVALGSEARTLRLVHTGFRMAREQGRPWVAVHVEVANWETAAESDQARVWLQEASDLGAETAWVRAATVSDGLIEEGARRRVAQVVMGKNRPQGPWDRLEHSRAQEAIRRALGVRIVSLPLDPPPSRAGSVQTGADLLGVVLAIGALLGVCTIFASALFTVVGFPGIPPVFALAVGFIAHRWGRAFSVPASVAALLIFAGWFLQGRFPYQPGDWTNGLYLAAALVLVQMVVVLVDRLHLETRLVRRREAETVLVMLLGRALGRCSTAREVALVLAERLDGLFQAQAWMLFAGEGDTWVALPESPEPPPSPRPTELLPQFSDTATRADPFEPLFMNSCTYVALAGPGGAEGLLQLWLEGGKPLGPESWGLFQSLAVQGALALERVRWLEAAQQARLDTESERLRNTLLGAVSHDLRTPLAAIQGAATSLLLPEPLPEATRLDLLAMIRDESERLARLLSDLLDLTRLQSGAIQIQKEWQLLDEVVGAAVLRIEATKGALPILVDLPESLPLVPLDGALMEQVLINLLGNAHRHAPQSPVELRAWEEPGSVELEIADRGPGIPAEFHQRVFDKFFRMPRDLKDGGVGLGLAICGAIVKIHDGAIWVENRPGGGARFRISLPLEGLPPAALETDHLPPSLESTP
ncbi:MAG: ATP-binding protein [Holophaga sp.]|nr:ATP-binding protein [Holophaga sp.]